MRWNPGISSSKIDDFRGAMEKWPDGFCYNWSIYEWEQAAEGDDYVMIRVGEGPCGLVYHGRFISDPYEEKDWAGTSRKRHYVDITVEDACDPDHPCIPVERLEEAIPEIEWRRGHSGQLITVEQADRLYALLEQALDI